MLINVDELWSTWEQFESAEEDNSIILSEKLIL